MAPVFKTCLFAAAMAGICSAAPVDKRDVAYDIVTDVSWVTLTSTITVQPIEAKTVTAAAHPHSTTEAPPPPPPATTSTSELPPPPPPSQTTTSTPPQSTSSSGGNSGSSGGASPIGSCSSGASCSGDGTYYDTATSMSAPSYCDTANDGGSENVLALSLDIMTQDLCGKTITATYGGKTVTGKVVDKCMGCSKDSIDMSRHMFEELASTDAGRITVDWWFS